MNEQENNTMAYEEEGISLSELFGILKKYIGWCIFGFLIVVGIGIAYVMTAIPQYESSATILVNPIQESSTMDSLLSESFSNGTKKIATETELLSSSLNIQRTLDQLDLSSYFNHDGIPYSDPTVLGGPGAVESLKKRLTVTTVKDTNLVKLTFTDSNPQFAHDFTEKLCRSYDVILTDIARNSKSAQRQFIENQIPENDAELKKATDALGDFRKASDIIQLTDKTSLLVSGDVYYQMKLEPLQMEYQEAQIGIAQFQKGWASAFSTPLPTVEEIKQDKEITSLLGRLNDLQEELTMYEAVAALNISGSANAGGTGTVLGMNAAAVSRTTQTQTRTNDLNNSILQVKKQILDRIGVICGVKGADTYYQSVSKLLSTEVLISVLQSREKVYSDELSKLPDLQTQLADLEREVKVYESVGLKLRDMLQETKLVEAAVNSNVTVIDAASMPIKPVKPNKMSILAVSALLGLAFGVLLALLINSQDDTISTIEELKKTQGKDIPMLTWIPFFLPNQKSKYPTLVVYNQPLSFQAERFKLIANLFYTNKPTGKLLSITSCGMAEGKSTIITNIAVSLAEMGKKVLLVDGDLRLPSLMPFFKLDPKDVKGMVDVVMGQETLDKVILIPIADIPNLHLLPSGTKPLVPSAIYTNPAMKKTLQGLEKLYDYIIIDAPPLLHASELLTIGNLVDGMLIVVRSEVTTKSGLRELIDTFNSASIRISGTVLNACGRSALVSANGSSRYGSYAYSYYGKGYGYGYGDGTPQQRHTSRWYKIRYRKDVKARSSVKGALGTAPLAFPEGMPEEQFETPVYNPLMHSLHTSATMHDDPDSLAGLNAIEKDPSAKGGKGH
ncbi:MAG: polysaccharide biosynthesis tyrosine autokinase [Sphaerochaeta sp.]|jgi:capsular exopolysaccharide synthesis family protein|nr:polysaccharide biosynthesis tyrosine autokinase [Sphaerochaeta sp.]